MSSVPDEFFRRSQLRRLSCDPCRDSSPPPSPRELCLTASISSMSGEFPKYKSINDGSFERKIEIEQPSMSFMRVETPHIGSDTFGDDITASALRNCKNTVLNPYHVFLKIIGWRRFSHSRDISLPLHYRILNVVWPVLLTILLLTSCVTQILSCFSRDYINPHTHHSNNGSNNGSVIQCKDHMISKYIILDIMLVFGYLYGVYLFRVKDPEHLSTFAETVFLGIISRRGSYSPKNLTRSLQFLLFLGISWIVYSMLTSCIRVSVHGYFDSPPVHFEFIPFLQNGKTLKVVTAFIVVISIIGFVVFDVAYTAVVINYCMQCQLLLYYIQGISIRVIDREWEIEQSIKEVHTAKQFLTKLNSTMSKATGVMMFIFLTSSFNAIYGLEELNEEDDNQSIYAITTALSIVQWMLWLMLPLIQAARVTRSGWWLVRTALEMRSRPLTYKDTPQLQLDSFLLYCSNVHMKAKLFGIPITSGMVIGGAVIVGFTFYLVFNLSHDSFSWAKWL